MSSSAPENWRQKVRRNLPFPPGRDAEQFEAIVTRDHHNYQLNLTTAEVFLDRGAAGWDQPSWLELPDVVRERIILVLQTDSH